MAGAAGNPLALSQMTLVDWLDDLTVRFLLNLPPAELSSVPRLCFQVEEAQWFYEDFIRPLNPHLPSLNLRQFCMTLFQHCPLLSGFDAAQHLAAYEEFLAYKVRVPVRGAILMDDTMEKVLLVRGWKKGASWSFPRGKINKNEKDIDCAIREVYEETGFNINAAGLVRSNEENGQVKAIDITMREQHMKLFIFRGVPLDAHFEPKTRKEISKIQWYNVRDLPGFKKNKGGPANGQGEAHANKFYMVAPFLGHLKKWIAHQRKKDGMGAQAQHHGSISALNMLNTGINEDEGDTETEVLHDHHPYIQTPSTDGLKKLLSIGSMPTTSLASAQEAQAYGQLDRQTNLLAMLQGGLQAHGSNANADLDQNVRPIFAQHGDFRTQSDERQLPMASQEPYQYQGIPEVSSLANYLQPQQQQYGSQPGAVDLPTLGSVPSHLPYMQPTQSRQQSTANVSGMFPSEFVQNVAPANQDSIIRPPLDQFQPHLRPRSLQQPAANLLAAFKSPPPLNPSDSLVNGPRVPEASKLPAPKLNAHAMKLLDAFKTTNSGSPANSAHDMSAAIQERAGGQQQAALLSLFNKAPVTGHVASENDFKTSSSGSTPLTAVEQALTQSPRRLTANEITRTLPLSSRLKSPASEGVEAATEPKGHPSKQIKAQKTSQAPASQTPVIYETQNPVNRMASPRQPAGRDNAPSLVNDNVSPSKPHQAEHGSAAAPIVSILQRPSSRHADGRSEMANKKTVHGFSSPTPHFSILQRPGSSTGKGPRQPVPQSPLRQASNSTPFQPQVLKRPNAGRGSDTPPNAQAQSSSKILPGKTDQLLALFGKSPTTISSPPDGNTTVPETEPGANPQQRDMLLNLFNTGNAQRNATSVTTTPPPAPQLAPERNPSRSQDSARQQNQQHLLNLISVQNSIPTGSPGTPISPFTLGTPITKLLPAKHQFSEGSGESRSRVGSVVSMVSNGTNSGRQTPIPSTVTPTETKGVLLEYLNGVVKEGYRGGKRS